MYNFYKMNLQLFADAGTLVNTSVNYANAYDKTQKTEFSGTNTLDPTIKTYYDKELLENARTTMYYTQFAEKRPLPANHGSTIEWRKWNTFARADKLIEGVIPEGQKFGMTKKTGAIAQYGTYASISDRLETRAFDDVILGATEEMSASLSETQETLLRNSLLTGTNVLYCDNVDETGKVLSTPTSCATMAAGGTTGQGESATPNGWSKLTPTMINKAATILKKSKVKPINGKYVCIIHPSVAFDLRQDEAWLEVHKYAATTEIFNGEIGELHGVRFIENPDAAVLSMVGETSYKNKAGGVTYASYFFGKDAYATIEPGGGNAEIIVKNRGEIGGPLEQFSTVGYKFETGHIVLYPERLLRVMSVSAYSAVDESNY